MAPKGRMLFSRGAAEDYRNLSHVERESIDRKIVQLYDRIGSSLLSEPRGQKTFVIGAGGPLRIFFSRSGEDTVILSIEKRSLRLIGTRQNSPEVPSTESEDLLLQQEEVLLNRIESAQNRLRLWVTILLGAIYISVPFALLSVFHYAIVVPIAAVLYSLTLLLGLVRGPFQRWKHRH